MSMSMMAVAPNRALFRRLMAAQWQESHYTESVLLNRFDATICGYGVTVRYSIQPEARFRHWKWEVRNRNRVLGSGSARCLEQAKHAAVEHTVNLALGDERVV